MDIPQLRLRASPGYQCRYQYCGAGGLDGVGSEYSAVFTDNPEHIREFLSGMLRVEQAPGAVAFVLTMSAMSEKRKLVLKR